MAILANTGFYGFISSCVRKGKEYVSDFQEQKQGWKIWKHATVGEVDKHKIEIDEADVRDNVRSVNYDPGHGKGFIIEADGNSSRAEIDQIEVRKNIKSKDYSTTQKKGFIMESEEGSSRAEVGKVHVHESVQSTDFNEQAPYAERKGFSLKNSGGTASAEVDTLNIRERIQSPDFNKNVSFLARKGFTVENMAGYTYVEFDEIFVRKRAVFKEIVIEQLNAIAGGLVISAAHGKVAAAEQKPYQYHVVFDPDISGSSDFIKGDMALCMRAKFEKETGQFEYKRYWCLVEKSGKTNDADCPLSTELKEAGEKYIILSTEQSEPGNGSPEEGDVIVQFGYITEFGVLDASSVNGSKDIQNRQRAVMISQLAYTGAAFVEYQRLGGTKPYFEIDEEKHEITRICGKGVNKFTGEFHISSQGGKTENLTDYMQSQIDGLKKLTEEMFSDVVLDALERNALIAELNALKQNKIQLDATGEALINFLQYKDYSEYLKISQAHSKMSAAFDSLEQLLKKEEPTLQELISAQDELLKSYSGYIKAQEEAMSYIRNYTAEKAESSYDHLSNLFESAQMSIASDHISAMVEKLALNSVNGELSSFRSMINQLPDQIEMKVTDEILVSSIEELNNYKYQILAVGDYLKNSLKGKNGSLYNEFNEAYILILSCIEDIDISLKEPYTNQNLIQWGKAFWDYYIYYLDVQEKALDYLRNYVEEKVDSSWENFEKLYGAAGLNISGGRIDTAVETLAYNKVSGELESFNSQITQLPNRISQEIKSDYKTADIAIEMEPDTKETHIEIQADKVKISHGDIMAGLFEAGKFNSTFIDAESIFAQAQLTVGDLVIDRTADKCPDLSEIKKEYDDIPPYIHDFSNDFPMRTGELIIPLKSYPNKLHNKKNSVITRVDSLVDTRSMRFFRIRFEEIYIYERDDCQEYFFQDPPCLFCDVKIMLNYDLDGKTKELGRVTYNKMQIGQYLSLVSISVILMEGTGTNKLFGEIPQGAELYYSLSIYPYLQTQGVTTPMHYKLSDVELSLDGGRTSVLVAGAMSKFFKDGFFCYKSPLNYFYYRIGDRMECRVTDEEDEITGTNSSIRSNRTSGYRILLNEKITAEGTGYSTVCVPQILRRKEGVLGLGYYNIATENEKQDDVRTSYTPFDLKNPD